MLATALLLREGAVAERREVLARGGLGNGLVVGNRELAPAQSLDHEAGPDAVVAEARRHRRGPVPAAVGAPAYDQAPVVHPRGVDGTGRVRRRG